MATISVPFRQMDKETRAQLEYALTFVSEDIQSYKIDADRSCIDVEVADAHASAGLRDRILVLIDRYDKGEFGLKKTVYFEHTRDLPAVDAWSELLQRKWITPVGEGHVVLRGPAAELAGFVDSMIDRVASQFQAERELYPATILCKTLDRIHHFTSFPEHLDFVSHIRRDLDTIDQYSKECKQSGWSPALHEGRMGDHDFAIAPSCCYHCYEAMEGWTLDRPGRCTTMTLACHRYEGANHKTMSRLRAFTQRDVVWVGEPGFVIAARARAEELIIDWAERWELAATLETANDMFFTDDFAVKASFQRQQQAKKELRLMLPFEGQAISVFSSNFHAMTFGKAFDIRIGGRHATSACVGWGIERWVYALFCQFGFDFERWPEVPRDEFKAYRSSKRSLA